MEVLMKRCPICFGLVHKKATKCRHCSSDLEEVNEYYEYIHNGFSLIEKECDTFNEKIEAVKGNLFQRYQYSEEELLHSSHLDKIRSIAGKIGSDIENWQERNVLPPKIKEFYNENVSILNDRFQFMMHRIKSRRYSLWERISEFFLCSYYFIINIALHHIKNSIVPYVKGSNNLIKPITILQKTAENFEHFLDEMQTDMKGEIIENFANSKRA
jgi:hypothetical protein